MPLPGGGRPENAEATHELRVRRRWRFQRDGPEAAPAPHLWKLNAGSIGRSGFRSTSLSHQALHNDAYRRPCDGSNHALRDCPFLITHVFEGLESCCTPNDVSTASRLGRLVTWSGLQ